MAESQLSKKDYEIILEFIDQIQNITNDFRHATLLNLSNYFGYNHLTFFLTDRNGRFVNPVSSNINPELTKAYVEHYYNTDIFYPVKVPNLISQKNVISIPDIMPYHQFEDTEYYRDFLRLDNLYYEIAVPLKVGNSLLGGIGVFNPKSSGNFDFKDILILEKLSGFISCTLNNFIQLNETSYEEDVLRNMSLQAPIGLIILNSSNSIIFSNNTAKDFCLDMLNDKPCLNPIQYIIDELFTRCTINKINSSPYLHTSINGYSFKMVSSLVPNVFSKLEPLIYIYVTEEADKDNKSLDKAANNYNLTNREIEIVELVLSGLNNKEISKKLFISYHTVKTHMENIFKKLQVDNRASLIHRMLHL